MKKFVAGFAALVLLISFTAVSEARYYDPSTVRFLSEDPIGFAGGDTNFYAYGRTTLLDSLIHLG